jgi:2-oxo-4-hydroxy-4-carboxy-5-ureidoimidazoline decarboxylase
MTLADFNALPEGDAARALTACCAATAWTAAMVAGRPYQNRDALLARSARVLSELDWAAVREALDAHPHIGELASRSSGTAAEFASRSSGTAAEPASRSSGAGGAWTDAAAADREADWSRKEQSGMDSASDDVRSAMAAANRAYEERFGHVFLIFATGRTDTEMLTAARHRLGNDDATERAVVRSELGRIVALRLERLLDS